MNVRDHLNFRVRQGSALAQYAAAAADRPGLSMAARLHDIVERYDAVMDSVPTAHRLSDDEMAMFMAAMHGWPLPSVSLPDFRLRIMARIAYHGTGLGKWDEAKALVDRIEAMTLAALILAVEQSEGGG